MLDRGSVPPADVTAPRADWVLEMDYLRQAALQTVALVLAIVGYAWAVAQTVLSLSDFSWAGVALPVSIGCLGAVILLVRRPAAVRSSLFIVGALAIGAVALYAEPSPYAPFVYIVVIGATTIAASGGMAFVAAACGSIVLLTASVLLPGRWQGAPLITALVLYWVAALTAWLTSRDLHTVLAWALRGYEENWSMLRQLQEQRGKLNSTIKALAEANALLKRTTHDLGVAREEAERARQLKGQFAANISHELRTPLHLIVGFSQMMHASPDTYAGARWTPELRADIQEIYDSAQHLLRLIDDVLDLSQVEAARLPLVKERFPLGPLIREAMQTAKSLLRGQGLSLHADIPDDLPCIDADPTRIRQVLLNLLNNASRFTERGGITVRAMVHEEDVEVVVEDTGIGIAPEQMQHIFSEFHQVSGTLRRRYGGTGLGLSICKQFVTLHNGRIWAESEVGKGSAFHFKLPLPGKESVPLQRSLPPVGGYYPGIEAGVPRRLVTLAQPAEFARLLRRHLSRVDILVAEDARHCAQMARTYQADAVVLSEEVADEALAGGIAAATADLMLPVVTCAVPLERHLALAAGFTHCLMKPFGADQLVRTIEQMAPDARRVLVVDDDQGVVRLIERSLAAAMPRLEVLTAYDGVEAIGLLEREPDLVLLDLLLPRANGLVVLQEQRLREQRAGSASTPTPVVAITAHGFEQDIAALGQGSISLRRGRYYSAEDITQWLQLMVDFRPARHLAAPGAIGPEPLFSGPEPGPALAPAPTA